MVAVREVPARFVTDSWLPVEEDGSVKNDPVGQRVLVPLKAGDPILASHFAPARDAELSAMVHPKGRAVTVDVQERNAVGLWVRPNDHVDVVGSFRDPQTQQLKSVTLLQNVVVLATGRVNASTTHVPDEDRRYTSVTLLVLPEEAEILTLAQETGTLTLLLRNPEDLDSQEKRAVVVGVNKFQVEEPFARAAFALKVGEVSDIVQTGYGLHLIKVTDRKANGPPSDFEKIKEEVREACAMEMMNNLVARERQVAKIEINLAGDAGAVKPASHQR